jgi:NAD(P)-dependent dehydrogenase (short-subunit alcohol dehydrogenase family)
LDEKVVVVTGASGLLGSKFCEIIIEYGGHPVLVDIDEEGSRILADSLEKKYSTSIQVFNVDITDETAVEESANKLMQIYGKIDALVNNAANNPKIEASNEHNFSRLERFSLDNWDKDIAVGLTGAFICAKHFGNKISANSSGGSIINIASDLGLIAPNQMLYKKDGLSRDEQPVKPVTYSVVKSGLIGLTRYLSTYWIDEGVRCNAVCPGGVKNHQEQEFLDRVSGLIPMKRLAYPDEYQGTLIWMLSDAASYLNGAIVPVDGGRTSW